MKTAIVISKLLGTGAPGDGYRAKVIETLAAAGIPASVSCYIPSKPDGHPRFMFCLCKVELDDAAVLPNDADFDDLPLNAIGEWRNRALTEAFTLAQRNAIATKLSNRFPGIDLALAGLVTVGDLIMAISRHVDAQGLWPFGE